LFTLKKTFNFIINILLPNTCLLCEKIISDIQKDNSIICEKCMDKLSKKIQLKIDDTTTFHSLYHYLSYEEEIRKILKEAKYRNNKRVLQSFLRDTINVFPEIRNYILIPIPISESKRKKRGYNQAQVIAEHIKLHNNNPIDNYSLKRIKDTKPLYKLGHDKRVEELKKAFLLDSSKIANRNFLIVDDICTTGTTIETCMVLLKEAGALNVSALVLARK
jgi:ComF family protein